MAFLPAKFRSYKKAVNLFDWGSSLVPNELVTCDDRGPPWMNRYTKNLKIAINDFHKNFVLLSSNMDNLFMFKNLQNQLIQSIHAAKQKYFNKISKKLCDPLTKHSTKQ